MTGALPQLLAFLSVLLLACPQAWCCVLACSAQDESRQESASCCGHAREPVHAFYAPAIKLGCEHPAPGKQTSRDCRRCRSLFGHTVTGPEFAFGPVAVTGGDEMVA